MIKVIITGSTGMVGRGVLLECLESPQVEHVLVINRSHLPIKHPKLTEVIHDNFFDFSAINDHLKGYDACFHCMGVSSVGMNETEYHRYTYDITEALATTLFRMNPNMVFNYVSGKGTDPTEKGKVMWARVKGKTENLILNMGFKDAYMFRLQLVIPKKGVKSKTAWINAFYAVMRPFFPLLEKNKNNTTSVKVGQAMINSVLVGSFTKILDNHLVNELAKG
ncbi:NAD-dependent epimerase/dehydratase family protein [Thermophagus sp. OGC60D27]|uniref:NAD-dependent epimerase/dehydratase family protein n=1 Tax=Thermophagus sp. OGC60D27 TaxID=3458415 RepID=UPI0040377798